LGKGLERWGRDGRHDRNLDWVSSSGPSQEKILASSNATGSIKGELSIDSDSGEGSGEE